jgi:hypothetical protein
MPELLAKSRDEKYVKEENEDFQNLLRGLMGSKNRIHLQVNGMINDKILEISKSGLGSGEKLAKLASVIDQKIWAGYKLWPSNYIAHDLLYKDEEFINQYTIAEKEAFIERLEEKVDIKNEFLVKSFLAMYANPVNNQIKNSREKIS